MINATFICLMIALIILIIVIRYLQNIKSKGKLQELFIRFMVLLTIPLISLALQILFENSSIPPIYFDYVTYIFTFFGPLELLKISILFYKPEADVKKVNYLYILSTICLLMLWTNDLHHSFYVVYSTKFDQTQYGILFYFASAYGYLIMVADMVILSIATIKRSGFFSKQFMLILLGILVPLVGNVLGLLNIIHSTIYVTPILFLVTSICFALAIFKYKALNITPIAFRTVINTMSDAYIVISDDGTIVDSNNTFKKIFENIFNFDDNENLFDVLKEKNIMQLENMQESIEKCRKTGQIISGEYHIAYNNLDRYFQLDIHPIKEKRGKDYVGTLLLFKDITQHKLDMKELKEKQEIIVKQGQLVSIGELAGGVAHDINTPISAIKTGILMLNTMEGQRTEEEKEILQRMDNCATKIINIVNSMRNQIRNLGGTTNVKFKIGEVVNDIKIITYHEVKKNNSDIVVDIQEDLEVQGDPTKLGQVLTNLVVNAAQAYGNTKGGKIDLKVSSAPNNMAMISITDYAGGLDESIIPYIFKNILTTKGTYGTGLGLYLAYSVIKGEFNGDITFDTQKGVGTTFYITIPKA